jgi:hypothetical protein
MRALRRAGDRLDIALTRAAHRNGEVGLQRRSESVLGGGSLGF